MRSRLDALRGRAVRQPEKSDFLIVLALLIMPRIAEVESEPAARNPQRGQLNFANFVDMALPRPVSSRQKSSGIQAVP